MRKKMYKKGKFWVVASIAITSAIIGANTVQADETSESTTSSSATSTTESTSTSSPSSETVASSVPVATSTPATAADQANKTTTASSEVTVTAATSTSKTDQTTTANQPATSTTTQSGTSGFRSAAPATNQAATEQSKAPSFVDVSSHNGNITTNDYKELANQGVAGVVVKLTEGASYKNPYAASQIKNAQEAGMQVSAYAYSHYTNEEEARQEARFFVQTAKELNLPSFTVMVNDLEEPKLKANINAATQAWTQEMKKLGFNDVIYYTAASWLDSSRWKGPIKTNEFGMQNFWVAQYPTKNLTKEDARELNYNNKAAAWQFTSNATLLKGKHVFDQSLDYTGRFTSKAQTVSTRPATAKVTVENINHTAGTYDVVISNLVTPNGVQRIVVPTWTENKGQDDITWNNAVKQADGTYRLTVKASQHNGEGGLYHSHVYIVEGNGNLAWGDGKQVTLSLPKASAKVTVENINHTAGTYDVVISNLVTPNGVQRIVVPTWTENKGQDDITWNNAVKQADGTYRLTVKASQHNGEGGLYHSHVYIVEGNGNLAWGDGKQVTLSLPKASAKVTVENINHTAGTYDVVISNLVTPNGVQRIVVPTWTENKGQDDITWNNAVKQADGTYRLTVKASQHNGEGGLYHSHVYIVEGNENLAWGGGKQVTLNLTRPITPENTKKDQRDAVIDAAIALLGIRGGSAEHAKLVRDYNSVRPLPVGYAVKDSDDWCDIFVTVLFQRQGLSDLIGRECGVERHINIFKQKGIWNEDGASTPQRGDIITFNWDQDSQPNNGWADHIGIVEKVENGIIYTIEGNSHDQVKRNQYRIGHGNIRGFARPNYA